MSKHHGYSISDIENLIPFEQDIFMDMIIEFERSIAK